MGTWRCPHCRTVQAESSRCFLCNRSATSCGTCANFRGSLIGGIGYCALDRKREALSGAEQRGCWTSALNAADDGLFAAPAQRREEGRVPPAPSIEARITPA